MDIPNLLEITSNPAAMAWAVAAIVAFIRKRIPTIKGDVLVVLAVVVALVLQVVVPFIPENLIGMVASAVGIGIGAAGTVDLATGVGAKIRAR